MAFLPPERMGVQQGNYTSCIVGFYSNHQRLNFAFLLSLVVEVLFGVLKKTFSELLTQKQYCASNVLVFKGIYRGICKNQTRTFDWSIILTLRSTPLSSYVMFVILLTPAPFSADTQNTLIPDFLTPKTQN